MKAVIFIRKKGGLCCKSWFGWWLKRMSLCWSFIRSRVEGLTRCFYEGQERTRPFRVATEVFMMVLPFWFVFRVGFRVEYMKFSRFFLFQEALIIPQFSGSMRHVLMLGRGDCISTDRGLLCLRGRWHASFRKARFLFRPRQRRGCSFCEREVFFVLDRGNYCEWHEYRFGVKREHVLINQWDRTIFYSLTFTPSMHVFFSVKVWVYLNGCVDKNNPKRLWLSWIRN